MLWVLLECGSEFALIAERVKESTLKHPFLIAFAGAAGLGDCLKRWDEHNGNVQVTKIDMIAQKQNPSPYWHFDTRFRSDWKPELKVPTQVSVPHSGPDRVDYRKKPTSSWSFWGLLKSPGTQITSAAPASKCVCVGGQQAVTHFYTRAECLQLLQLQGGLIHRPAWCSAPITILIQLNLAGANCTSVAILVIMFYCFIYLFIFDCSCLEIRVQIFRKTAMTLWGASQLYD